MNLLYKLKFYLGNLFSSCVNQTAADNKNNDPL